MFPHIEGLLLLYSPCEVIQPDGGLHIIFKYHNIQSGKVEVYCDWKISLTQIFDKSIYIKHNTNHHDFIMGTKNLIQHLPIEVTHQYNPGNQDLNFLMEYLY